MATSDNPALVPGQIPPDLTQKVINTAGTNGDDGSKYSSTSETATYGQDGSSGRYSTSPTEGSSGQDIHVNLKYDSSTPDSIEVVSQEHGRLEISSHEWLLLDARGGNGGNGGWGENGQHGGAGYDGANATLYTDGQNGGRGGSGGNGGYGTNGANGGRGGDVFTTVSEDELDLLLAVGFNVKGGSGGDAGRHGVPGRGGPGGLGGAKFSGYSSDREKRTKINRPGGSPGPHGPDGNAPSTILSSGESGEDGNTSINVVMNSETVMSYVNRYFLLVESFEVVDENNDGINEPGEYLIVKNIIVRNNGHMPSPSGQLIKVVIRESTWLEPDTTAPLTLPDSIMPQRQARIPGQLRAFIRHETVYREPGKVLNDHDTVSLLAYSQRLRRSIPEFSGGVPIIVQYPLQLIPLAYMDCMEKSEAMTISWTVNNVSTEIYGHASDNSRATRTKFIDTGRNFVLQSATEELNYMEDVIDRIQPATGNSFSETLTVANETKTFSTGSVILELHLSDPHSGEMRRIMRYEIDIQISEGYRFNASSQFLLIVNASTDNEAITQMQKFIRSQLYLGVDTLNLSLTGTIIDDESRKSALLNYRGKSIIISGNPFTYFREFLRYNWDLLDPQDALMLLMNGTSFMFCGVLSQHDEDSLAEWTALMRYPTEPRVETAERLVEHKDRRALLKSICTRPSLDNFNLDLRNQYTLSSSSHIFQSKIEKRLQNTGTTLSKDLGEQVPMRRFIVTSEEGSDEVQAPSTGVMSVVEGLSRSSNCMISRLSIVDSLGMITPHQATMMIASIPFNILVVMFWNIIRSVRSNGITPDVMYRNLPVSYTHLDLEANHQYAEEGYENGAVGLISYKLCKAVAWAVERSLDSDVQQLCNSSPMIPIMDTLTKKSALTHTPRLQQFLHKIPNDSSTASQEGIELAVQVLGSLNAALRASNIIIDVLTRIPGLSTRRVKLRRKVSEYTRQALLFMVPPAMVKDIKKRIKEERKKLGRELRKNTETPRIAQNIIRRKLATLTTDSTNGFVDISAAEEGSIYMAPNSFQRHRSTYRRLLNQQRDDALHARETREETTVNVYATRDFLPFTDFN